MVSNATLRRVYFENVAANQIGGEHDGISESVAADLGYTTLEGMKDLLARNEPSALAPVAPPKREPIATEKTSDDQQLELADPSSMTDKWSEVRQMAAYPPAKPYESPARDGITPAYIKNRIDTLG